MVVAISSIDLVVVDSHRIPDRRIGQPLQDINTITVVETVMIRHDLIDAIHATLLIHAGTATLCAAL